MHNPTTFLYPKRQAQPNDAQNTQTTTINTNATTEPNRTLPEPERTISLAPPVNTGVGERVAVGRVAFLVGPTVGEPVPAGAVTIVMDEHGEDEGGNALDDDDEADAVLDFGIPLQNPATQVLKAHCESLAH